MYVNFEVLEGQTLVAVTGNEGWEELIFETKEGNRYKMYHEQDCCESVYLEDVNGDWEEIVGNKIIAAYEACADATDHEDVSESGTWTFYHIRTTGGDICLRWLGESNGYYSESVKFVQL